jgi:hypothetical protein
MYFSIFFVVFPYLGVGISIFMVGDDDNQIKKRLLINMLEISYERTTMQSR